MTNRRYLTAILTLALGLALGPALAKADDQPTPGVARISLIHGDVATQRGDSGDVVAASLNTPVVEGDNVTSGARSRAEVQLDYANVIRLDQNSSVKVAGLTRTHIQIQLAQGVMTYSVFKGNEADIEIDTPNMAVHPVGVGTYRVQVDTPQETELIVREGGQANVTTPQGSTMVNDKDRIVVKGTDSPEYQISKAPGRDEWDNWNRDRDHVIENASSYRYTNRYYTGSQDLDRYGHWVQVPDHDWCWTPYVDAGWVPYSYGRWVWEPYWGWTWVSHDPWGWAPYHYGRWFVYGSSWYWWPGVVSVGYYPVWAPAYVSFIGFGFGYHHFGFGFGYGYSSIGWCPLAPFDPIYPWWGFHNRFNSVNITNITNVTNITNITNVRNGLPTSVAQGFRNPRWRQGITTVSTNDFVNGRVTRRMGTISEATLRSGQMIRGTVPAVPTRESLRPTNRTVSPALAARANTNPRFFTRQQPPAVNRSFETQAAGVRQMMQSNPLQARANEGVAGRPSAVGAQGAANTSAAVRGGAQAGRGTGVGSVEARATTQAGAQAQANNRGRVNNDLGVWQRFGRNPGATVGGSQPGGQQANRPAPSNAPRSTQSAQPGWQRFGAGNAPQAGRSVAPSPRGAEPGVRGGSTPNQQAPARVQGTDSGWQRFNAPASRGQTPAQQNRTIQQSAPRGVEPRSAAPQTRGNSGWQQFTPRAQPAPRSSSFSEPRNQSAAPSGGWNRFTPQPQAQPNWRQERSSGGWNSPRQSGGSYAAPRSEYRGSGGGGGGRPPLEMRKPIVTERGGGGGYYGAPRGGGGGNYSAPRGGGSYSAPRSGGSYSAPRGGGGGGGRSAPTPRSGGDGGRRH